MAINGTYRYIHSAIEWPELSTAMSSDAVTDILGTRYSASNFYPFKRGELTSSSALVSTLWRNNYQGINRANSLLENMYKGQEKTSPELYSRIEAEARTLRALCYIELIKNFGDVPLIIKPLTMDELLTVTRTPVQEVLQFIYSELDASGPNLPLKYDNTEDKGRLTRGAALALKARIALFYKDYPVAKTAAKACIDLGVYKLYPNYRDLFTIKGEYSNEIIIDYQFAQTLRENQFFRYAGTRNSNGQSQIFPTEDMVASFECSDGLPIDESPLYDPTNPFVNRDPRLAASVLLPRVWDGETVKTYGTKFYGFEFKTSKERIYKSDGKTLEPSCLAEMEKTVVDEKTGKTVANQEVTNAFSSYTGYVIYKYYEEQYGLTPNNCYTNFIMCRFAEVLLTYAEASIELGQIDQTVLDAINMVRARAYGNTSSSGVTDINAANYPKVTVTDQTSLRKLIRRERKVELCFEGFRLDDLRRWGLLEKALSGYKLYGRPENFTKMRSTDKPEIDDDCLMKFPYAEDKYGGVNGTDVRKLRYREDYGIINSKHYLFPIPLTELELNPGLKQNTGY
jgi:hypothetical protein